MSISQVGKLSKKGFIMCEALFPTQQEINKNTMAIYKPRHLVAWGKCGELSDSSAKLM